MALSLKKDAEYINDNSDHGMSSSGAELTSSGRTTPRGGLISRALSRSNSEGPTVEKEGRVFAPEQSKLESLNIEESESVMWRKFRVKEHYQAESRFLSDSQSFALRNWALVFLVGIIIGLVGAMVIVLTSSLLQWKFNAVNDLIENDKWAEAFFAYIFFALFFVLIALFIAYLEPKASGSGISEVKVYLNGVNLVGFLKPQVIIGKAIGLCFSVASGLPIGKKAPMVHVGASVAATVSQGRHKFLSMDTSWSVFPDFRNDKMVTDCVTIGIAGGIAAVFRAPIGGVLFALEESASHWSAGVTIKAFICAMVALVTVNILFADSDFGTTKIENLFVFGQFQDLIPGQTNYRTFELFIFILMGFTGGIIGASFNKIMEKITLKNDNPEYQKWQYVRVIVFTVVMALVSFFLPLMWQDCNNIPAGKDLEGWSKEEIDLLDDLVQFQCNDGEYNQLASLYFCPAETALKQLFHFREYKGSQYSSFGFGSLILFFFPYFLLSAGTAGLKVPRGVFIPTLLAGASYGRFWGHLLNTAFPGGVADSGTYALVGAAAINGGVTRITISMTIIMLETSGNMTYLLPLMVTFIAARYSGNAINAGLYDLQIYLDEMPFVVSSLRSLGLLNYSPISSMMASPLKVFHRHERVSTIYNVLKDTRHNGFPVITSDGKLQGLILRQTLCSLLEMKAFSKIVSKGNDKKNLSIDVQNTHSESISLHPSRMGPHAANDNDIDLEPPSKNVFYDILQKKYPKFTEIDDIVLEPNEMELWLDLTQYTDTGSYTVHLSTSLERAHKLFRTMAIRHLIVVNNSYMPVGMITRKDIMYSKLHSYFVENRHSVANLTADSMTTSHASEGLSPTSTASNEGTVISSNLNPFGVIKASSYDPEDRQQSSPAKKGNSATSSKKPDAHAYMNADDDA